MKTLNRRALLRGVGGAAIALPYLEIMMPRRVARAQGGGGLSKVGANGRPKRFVRIHTPNGHGIEWFNNKMGSDGKLVLGRVLAPMERHKDDLILIDGLANRTSCVLSPNQFIGVDGGHERPWLHLGACVPHQNRMAGGITIDQTIANEIGGGTKLKSLAVAALLRGDNNDWLSYTAAQAPIIPLADPAAVFSKLFADFQTDPAVFKRVQAKRQSILDSVKKNYEGFIGTLGGDDQRKVKDHIEGIRQLEAGLAKKQLVAGSGGGACAAPAVPEKKDLFKCQAVCPAGTAEQWLGIGRQMSEFIALAFACDLTRVATLNLHWQRIPSIGLNDGSAVHDISHDPPESPRKNDLSVFHVKYVAEILDKLKAAQDGPGASVWDNTVFYWTSEIGCSGFHNNNRQPWLVAGSAGGYFKTGRLLNLTADPKNVFQQINSNSNGYDPFGPGIGELYVSFLNAMGIPATTFGVPDLCRGPLPQMV